MSFTPFPKGITSMGVPVLGGGATIPLTTGTYFFVHHNGSNAYDGKDSDHPFADFDYAIGQCTAGKSDVILGMPGHAETISSAGAITADIADITIQGLGDGLSRPTITYDTGATTIINVTGANTKFRNLIFSANYADITMAIDVDAVGFQIEYCQFRDTATDMDFVSCIGTDDTANAADDLVVVGNEYMSVDVGNLAFVSILGNITGLRIQGNITQSASITDAAHFLIMGSFVCLKSIITDNICIVTGANTTQSAGLFATSSSTTSTGVMARNYCGSLDNDTPLFDDDDNDFMHFENLYTGVIAKQGYLVPAADS